MTKAATAAQTASATGLKTPTRRALLSACAAALEKSTASFRTIRDIENMKLDQLRATSVKGTIFETMMTTMNARGLAVQGTVGDVMDKLGLSHEDVHAIACACHEGSDVMNGDYAAMALRDVGKQA